MQQVYQLKKLNKTSEHTIIWEHPKAICGPIQKQFTTAICTAEKAIVTRIISS